MALTAARTSTRRRARFQRAGNVLVDRTRTGHTTFIHGSRPPDATAEVIRRIDEGDYRELALLLSSADIKRVRPVLLAKAEAASTLDPNLAQALALVGGVAESRILQRHVRESSRTDFGARTEDDQLRVVYSVHALLQVRPSLVGARMLVEAVTNGTSWTRQVTARLVSENLLARSTLRVERILLRALPSLLVDEDGCFVSAFPILLRRHFQDALQRSKRILVGGTPSNRRSLLLGLISCPYYGLPLLRDALRTESQLDLRLMIATEIAPMMPATDLSSLISEALDDKSPAIRMNGARLLEHLDEPAARRLARRKDPEPMVDTELGRFRKQRR